MESGSSFAPPERAAAVVAVITIGSRMMGLIRTVAVTSILGVTYLGNTYATANTIPNLFFEILAGGALAAALVPALAGPASKGDVEETSARASTFLNLTLLVLTPAVVLGLLMRTQLMELMTARIEDPQIRDLEIELGRFFLLLFLPQIWLYGAGMVLTGALHSRGRFASPALAPLLSSVVVTASYFIYKLVEGQDAQQIASISSTGRGVLGLGTTLGVAILAGTLLIPAHRAGLRWRPRLRLPKEVTRTSGSILASAAVAIAAQQVMLGVVLQIGNRVEGGVVAFSLAFTILLLPWAVLAVSLSTATFPRLAAAAVSGEEGSFRALTSSTSRLIILLCCGAAALLIVAAEPGTLALLSMGAGGGVRSSKIVTPALVALAPGLIPYGMYAFLTRSAYARGDGMTPMLAAIAGFGSAIVMDLILASKLREADLITGLAGSFSVGMLISSAILVARLRSTAGAETFSGLGSAILRGLTAGSAAAAAGVRVAAMIHPSDLTSSIVSTTTGVLAAGIVYILLQRLMRDRDLRTAIDALRGRP